jgi:hypothetical protein
MANETDTTTQTGGTGTGTSTDAGGTRPNEDVPVIPG